MGMGMGMGMGRGLGTGRNAEHESLQAAPTTQRYSVRAALRTYRDMTDMEEAMLGRGRTINNQPSVSGTRIARISDFGLQSSDPPGARCGLFGSTKITNCTEAPAAFNTRVKCGAF